MDFPHTLASLHWFRSAIRPSPGVLDRGIGVAGVLREAVHSGHPSIRHPSHVNAYRPTLPVGQDLFHLAPLREECAGRWLPTDRDDTRQLDLTFFEQAFQLAAEAEPYRAST